MSTDRINIYQAAVLNEYSPHVWTINQAERGWLAKRGEAVLIVTNSKLPRFFSSVEVAIRRLQLEAGIFDFEVALKH